MPYDLTPRTQEQLRKILNNAAEHSGEGRRLQIEETLLKAFQAVAANPGIGHLRKDIVNTDLYFHYAGPYAVIYRRYELPTQIIAVIHGSRDLAALLQDQVD